jgi:hypothetical protein
MITVCVAIRFSERLLVASLCELITMFGFHFQIDEPSDVRKAQDQLAKACSDLQNTLQRIQAPNMRALEK